MPLEPSGLVDARARYAAAREDLAQAEALASRADPAACPEDLAGRLRVVEVALETLVGRLVRMGVMTEMAWLGLAADRFESELARLEAQFLGRP